MDGQQWKDRLGSLGIVACREYKSKKEQIISGKCVRQAISCLIWHRERVCGGISTAMRRYCPSVRKSGFLRDSFSIDAGAGKHTYLLQESGKTINVDAKIKQLNDINWIEIGYKEGDTFSVYGKEYAIDSSGHINVSAEDEFTSTEIKYPSRSI